MLGGSSTPTPPGGSAEQVFFVHDGSLFSATVEWIGSVDRPGS